MVFLFGVCAEEDTGGRKVPVFSFYCNEHFTYFVKLIYTNFVSEEKTDSQEIRLLRFRDGRIGNDNNYDDTQGQNNVEAHDLPLFPLDLTLEATRNFSNENKLGQGGFGPVYKVCNCWVEFV